MSTAKISPFFFLTCQELLIGIFVLAKRVKLNGSDFFKIFPMSLFFFGNLAFGLIGMQYINLAMYVCIRKLTTLLVFLTDLSSQSVLSGVGVAFITIGGLYAGVHDLTGSLLGYCIAFLSVLMNVGQLLYSKSLSKNGYDSTYVFFYSSLIVLPLSFSSSYVYEKITFPAQLFLLIFSCFSSLFASFMTIYCSSKVSPLATSVSGNFKDAFSMFLGLVIFKEPYTDLFFYGLLISTLGALIFSYSKLAKLKES